jgi:hypothetical protein
MREAETNQLMLFRERDAVYYDGAKTQDAAAIEIAVFWVVIPTFQENALPPSPNPVQRDEQSCKAASYSETPLSVNKTTRCQHPQDHDLNRWHELPLFRHGLVS